MSTPARCAQSCFLDPTTRAEMSPLLPRPPPSPKGGKGENEEAVHPGWFPFFILFFNNRSEIFPVILRYKGEQSESLRKYHENKLLSQTERRFANRRKKEKKRHRKKAGRLLPWPRRKQTPLHAFSTLYMSCLFFLSILVVTVLSFFYTAKRGGRDGGRRSSPL